jgi:activator of 2-hydroxyglutaryl-CoA dehydratase
LDLQFVSACGHMTGDFVHENEIIALAKGAKKYVEPDSTVLDLGSRDAKWISFKDGKFHDMDWNTSCASSTGATVEMLLKFYEVDSKDLKFDEEKFSVTCGIFGMEKIMDSISNGISPNEAISKFVHGIAFNAWNFAKRPEKIYLSGGFCENQCLVDSLKHYCDVVKLGRFVLCEGLI